MEDRNFKQLRTGKPHISFSEISNWNSCSYSHYLKQVLKIGKNEESIYLTFGTAVHAAIESFLKTGLMDISLALNILNEAYTKFGTDEKFHRGITLEDATLQATQILTEFPVFMDKNFPGWKALEAEFFLYEPIDAKPDHAFKGYVDAIIIVPNKKGKMIVWILDFKTTTSYWSREKKQDLMVKSQLVYYKHYVSKKLNIPMKDIRCAFLLLKRRAKPDHAIEKVDVSVGDVTVNKSLKIMNNMISGLHREVTIKNRTSCDWCEFRDTEHCTMAPYRGKIR